jgi:hypothetical protein
MCESAGAADQLESDDQQTVRGVDIKSKGGWTPLSESRFIISWICYLQPLVNAASKGHLPVVLYLLTKQAADPMARHALVSQLPTNV